MKKDNKNTRKVVSTAVAMAFVGAMAVGGTMAYLTDSEAVTNTFTVGNVSVDLTEPDYEQTEKPRVPNEEIAKDPTVKNTGDNDAIMFLAVDIPMADVVVANAAGEKQTQAYTELFDFRSEAGTYDSVNNGWVQVWAKTDSVDAPTKKTYLYAYKQPVLGTSDKLGTRDGYTGIAGDQVPSLFDYVRLANTVEGQITDPTLDMDIRSYSIQASFLQSEDNSTGNHNIALSDEMTAETLGQIYNIFATQNPEATQGDGANATDNVVEADTNGKLDLKGNALSTEAPAAPQA